MATAEIFSSIPWWSQHNLWYLWRAKNIKPFHVMTGRGQGERHLNANQGSTLSFTQREEHNECSLVNLMDCPNIPFSEKGEQQMIRIFSFQQKITDLSYNSHNSFNSKFELCNMSQKNNFVWTLILHFLKICWQLVNKFVANPNNETPEFWILFLRRTRRRSSSVFPKSV